MPDYKATYNFKSVNSVKPKRKDVGNTERSLSSNTFERATTNF